MAITLNDFSNGLSDEAGEDFTDAGVAALFKAWVKEAYIRTASSARFLWQNESFAQATTSSVAEYTLDATVAEIKAIRNISTEMHIGYTTEETLSRLGTDFEATGSPTHWFYSGIDATSTALKITFVPVPDATYNLDIRALIRAVTLGDATIIPLPVEFVEIMRDYVRSMYQLNDDRTQLSQLSMQSYQQALFAMIQRYTSVRSASSGLRMKRNLQGAQQGPAATND